MVKSLVRGKEISPRDTAPVDQIMRDLSVQSSGGGSGGYSIGHLDINGPETNYVGATHWATILENVRINSHRVILGVLLIGCRFETSKAFFIPRLIKAIKWTYRLYKRS